MDDAAPSPWRGHLAALGALRRRVAAQSSVDTAEGVKARRVLFSLGNPSGELLAALDHFERTVVEASDPPAIEVKRLKCLAILDRLIASSQPPLD